MLDERLLKVAQRILDIDPYEAADADATPEAIAEDILNDPAGVLEYLLDILEEQQVMALVKSESINGYLIQMISENNQYTVVMYREKDGKRIDRQQAGSNYEARKYFDLFAGLAKAQKGKVTA